MPRKVTPGEIIAKLDWVRELPDSAWARGVIDTAESVVSEIDELGVERTALDDKIKARMKVLRLIPAASALVFPIYWPEA